MTVGNSQSRLPARGPGRETPSIQESNAELMETQPHMTTSGAMDSPIDSCAPGEAANDDWIRGEVADAARILQERNLGKANAIAKPVSPADGIYVRYVKRGLDIVLSAAALLVTLPINGVLAILTFRDVGSPVLFRQKRSGRNLEPFDLVKFRNMTNERDENGELLPPEMRTTDLGRFVRQHSLDELLNFWSVFKGDMSLIGPRPLPIEYTPRMSERHKQRYYVRPGLECPLIDPTLEERYDYSHARFENDIAYVESVSFLTDVKQAFRLVAMVLRRGKTTNFIGSDSHFIGYDSDGHAMSQGRLKDRACYEREVLGQA